MYIDCSVDYYYLLNINIAWGLKEVRSKILILLETTGGILFSLEGFEKCVLQFKTLLRVIYIPLEGFRYNSRGVVISLEGFSYPS